ncbi:hypothetical protein BDD12DRAFT_982726 [Trichophaea hybrida]|nr:hypothetical protein BDD12DRAFT_982726 [Trichophaea hybrida]
MTDSSLTFPIGCPAACSTSPLLNVTVCGSDVSSQNVLDSSPSRYLSSSFKPFKVLPINISSAAMSWMRSIEIFLWLEFLNIRLSSDKLARLYISFSTVMQAKLWLLSLLSSSTIGPPPPIVLIHLLPHPRKAILRGWFAFAGVWIYSTSTMVLLLPSMYRHQLVPLCRSIWVLWEEVECGG